MSCNKPGRIILIIISTMVNLISAQEGVSCSDKFVHCLKWYSNQRDCQKDMDDCRIKTTYEHHSDKSSEDYLALIIIAVIAFSIATWSYKCERKRERDLINNTLNKRENSRKENLLP
jgi:hypothetical protein